MAKPKYDVFLSHATSDKPVVEALARLLEREGLIPWFDKENLPVGVPWQEAIEKALEDSASCAVCLGPSGLGPWQNEEMRVAKDRQVSDWDRPFPVIPVFLPGAEVGDWSQLPSLLRRNSGVVFRETLDDKEALRRLISGISSVAPKAEIQSGSAFSGSIFRGSQSSTPMQLQLAIAEQNRLLEAQLQPLFRLVPCTRLVGSEAFDSLEVWNDGSPMERYNIHQRSFIQVVRLLPDKNGETNSWEHRYIAAYYFFRREYQAEARTTGLLVTLHAWREWRGLIPVGHPSDNVTKEYERLEREVREQLAGVAMRKRVFLDICYVDRAGVDRLLTYEIYPSGRDGLNPQVPVRSNDLRGVSMAVAYEIKNLTASNLFDQLPSFAGVGNDGV